MASKWFRTVMFVALVLAPAGVWAQATTRVGPRDQVTVSVFGDDKFSGKFTVDSEGQISYPTGPIKVAGLTIREVEIEIGRQLKVTGQYLNIPSITVELVQLQNKSVTVIGAVRSATSIPFAGELTLLEAIVRAGSETSDASDDVRVVRMVAPSRDAKATDDPPEPLILHFRLSDLRAGRVTDGGLLQDRDIVTVEKAAPVTIDGAVQSPGQIRVDPGTTVRAAVALAGGITERGSWNRIRIKRNGKDVKDVKEDTIVQPGDIITIGNRAL